MVTTLEQAQPRYRAYCIANNAATATEMWKRDGNGMNFMRWIQGKWKEWETLNNCIGKHHFDEDHKAFDEWLLKLVSEKHRAEKMVEGNLIEQGRVRP